jgi:hypothetical protein
MGFELNDLVLTYVQVKKLAGVCIQHGAGRMILLNASVNPFADLPKLYELEWIGWCRDYETAHRLSEATRMHFRGNPIIISASTDEVIEFIVKHAIDTGMKITAHADMLTNAREMVAKIKQGLALLQSQGQLSAFNDAYRAWRLREYARGRRVPGYETQLGELRMLIAVLDNGDLRVAMAEKFPWLTEPMPAKQGPRAVGQSR